MEKTAAAVLNDVYRRLMNNYGPQHWWPAETAFEVVVGAVLTQSAAWTNVEKAILKLKAAGVMTPSAMQMLSQSELAEMVHSCGYFNMKAKKLLAVVEWLCLRYDGSLERLAEEETTTLRQGLLSVYGIGEETADSILLYAAGKPVFVIDAYTRRIIDRLGLAVEGNHYADYQQLFNRNLDPDRVMFNEYHALLVALGKNCCGKTGPQCEKCCLGEICAYHLNPRPVAGIPRKTARKT